LVQTDTGLYLPTDIPLDELLHNKKRRIEQFLWIDDKRRQLVPVRLNPIQNDVITTETGMDIYVKPAQVGFTSAVIGDYLLDTIFNPGTVSVIISYEEFITQRLLRKAQFFYDRLNEAIPSIPQMHHASAYEKTFPDINSSFYIGSARAYTFGRGEAIHNLLMDEYAFWDAGSIERITVPILQRVPAIPYGNVKIGSTANGAENAHCYLYKVARDMKSSGGATFTAHFYPWTMHPEYRLPRNHPAALANDKLDLSYTAEEEALVHSLNITEDQVRWRRYKKVEMEQLLLTGETRKLFAQEYPEDDESCFLTAGDMVYDGILVKSMMKEVKPPVNRIVGADIWYPSEEGKKYFVGVDPGVGKESQSVAEVWHFWEEDGKTHGLHCATLGGYLTDEQLRDAVVELAKYYNNAKICPEANSQGLELIALLKGYANKYYRKDIVSGRTQSMVGWLTTPRTKPYMIKEFARLLPYITTHDRNLLTQMGNIRWYNERPISVGADDYHDAAALAIVCRDDYRGKIGFVGTSGWKTW